MFTYNETVYAYDSGEVFAKGLQKPITVRRPLVLKKAP